MKEIAIGVILGLTSILLSLLFSLEQQSEIWGFLMIIIASIYIGFGISDGRIKEMITEIIAGSIFIILAILGIWESTYFLVIAYIGHGFWDIIHKPKLVDTNVQKWYPKFCMFYDWVIGLWLIYLIIIN